MTDAEKTAILQTARAAVQAAVQAGPQPAIDSTEPIFDEKRGVFVTLKTGGRLRGCIGRFDPSVASATQDPRFLHDRIMPKELPELSIEVSVLSPLEKTDDPLSIELGVHGIYIKKGFQSGCFLPQVATETGWSKEEFLSTCAAHKAGLDPDAWRDPDTEVYVFTADILSESK